MIYLDGTEILVGDSVFTQDGRTPGVIVDVVEADRTAEIGVDEPGVMIKCEPFGLLYLPIPTFESEGLVFEARANQKLPDLGSR